MPPDYPDLLQGNAPEYPSFPLRMHRPASLSDLWVWHWYYLPHLWSVPDSHWFRTQCHRHLPWQLRHFSPYCSGYLPDWSPDSENLTYLSEPSASGAPDYSYRFPAYYLQKSRSCQWRSLNYSWHCWHWPLHSPQPCRPWIPERCPLRYSSDPVPSA